MADITIIGSGNMARAIGTRAVAAGRSLQILSRSPEHAANVVEISNPIDADTFDSLTVEPGSSAAEEIASFAAAAGLRRTAQNLEFRSGA
ncbi:NAD(P)-binding domain-containing protein [Pseudarthrobacter sp. PvP090]|uniref:NAD(P)-binding domain-containing protein n=1 Tax=Pseudarthrobacter sp. PvP090 TaxID=3156393 RepID=UPI003398DB8E